MIPDIANTVKLEDKETEMKIVFLLTIDALRKDALGCYGNEKTLTPFIDSLTNRCILFTKAQSSGPYTQASFPGLLSSSYYLEYGSPKMLSTRKTLISEALQPVGIVTAAFHSNPYLSAFFGWNRGWNFFYDSMNEDVSPLAPYVKGSVINDKVNSWLSDWTRKGGCDHLFLWLHYMDIHEPYIPDQRYVDMVDPSVDINQDDMYRLFKEVLLKRNISDKEKVKLLKTLYDAHVREVDDYVKAFFAMLEKNELLKDSVIIITSDHGDEFGEHGGLSHDDKMYCELINIPLLVYDPTMTQGEICDRLISNIDIPPTIMHLFGLEPAKNFAGCSLLPTETYREKGCFGEAIYLKGGQGGDIDKDIYFYRRGDLKIIYRSDHDHWEMYDLRRDLGELKNIVDVSPEADDLKDELKPRVRRWLRKELRSK